MNTSEPVKKKEKKEKKEIYLASSSPRRAELLTQMGISFERVTVDIDESCRKQEKPIEYVARLALEKAINGHQQVKDKTKPVLGSDTAIYVEAEKSDSEGEKEGLEGKILGKPQNIQDAYRMLRLLSANTHQVLTAVTLVNENKQATIVQTSNVTMRKIKDDEIKAYWESGEPKGKAGAYAIQGKAAVFISNIQGSYSGVMGLPIFETANLLAGFDVK